jgi:hypothetical protein
MVGAVIRLIRHPVRVVAVLVVAALTLVAQRGFRGGGGFGGFGFGQQEEEGPSPNFKTDTEFHFIRGEYTDSPNYRRGFGNVSRRGRANGWWAQDWPDADEHFTQGVLRLTRIDAGDPRHLGFSDEKIFDNPWVYMTQTAYWALTETEIARMHEFLERGGFLVTDDFWGPYEWEVFQETMQRVLPNHAITDIALGDSVMHVLYDIQEKDLTYIPGTRHLRRGPGGQMMVQQQGNSPAWRAIYDDKQHMVVAINFNTDVGDAWEYADSPMYPEAMTTLAYRYGINYVIYAMTH